MSYKQVINHLENVLNSMGNNIQINTTGNIVNSDIPGNISIEIKPIKILNSFNQSLLPTPRPQSKTDANTNTYSINRIRLSTSMIGDYSEKYPYSDNELLQIILGKDFLFGYY